MSNAEEIEAQLKEYEEQLAGIEELLAEDDQNEELLALKAQTVELIQELSSLLTPAAPASSIAKNGSISETVATESYSTGVSEASKVKESENRSDEADSASAALLTRTSVKQVVPVTSNLTGQAEKAVAKGLYVGLPSEAIWPEDGLWYPATIEAIGDNGVRVKFKSYGDVMTLGAEQVRASSVLLASLSSNEKKRKQPTDDHSPSVASPSTTTPVPTPDSDMPEYMRIQDTDNGKTIDHKKRLQKAWKAERRKEKQEVSQNLSKVSWQNFNKSSKKTGIGGKKESMFRTSETGKIGVIGSGQGMTKQSTHVLRHTSIGNPPSSSYDPLAVPTYYIPSGSNPTAPPPYYPPSYPNQRDPYSRS